MVDLYSSFDKSRFTLLKQRLLSYCIPDVTYVRYVILMKYFTTTQEIFLQNFESWSVKLMIMVNQLAVLIWLYENHCYINFLRHYDASQIDPIIPIRSPGHPVHLQDCWQPQQNGNMFFIFTLAENIVEIKYPWISFSSIFLGRDSCYKKRTMITTFYWIFIR